MAKALCMHICQYMCRSSAHTVHTLTIHHTPHIDRTLLWVGPLPRCCQRRGKGPVGLLWQSLGWLHQPRQTWLGSSCLQRGQWPREWGGRGVRGKLLCCDNWRIDLDDQNSFVPSVVCACTTTHRAVFNIPQHLKHVDLSLSLPLVLINVPVPQDRG